MFIYKILIYLLVSKSDGCKISGILYTRKSFPANNVIVSFKQSQTISNKQGEFELEIESNQVQGELSFNIANQFTMQMEINRLNCPINLGRILLDNKESVQTSITGCVIKRDNLQSVSDTIVSIIYDQPTLLDIQEIKTGKDGCFLAQNKLMKLLIYQASISINLQGYFEQLFVVQLFDQYIADLGQIYMNPNYYIVNLQVNINRNCQQNQTKAQNSIAMQISFSCGCEYKDQFMTQKDINFIQLDKAFKDGFEYTCGIMVMNPNCGILFSVIKVKEKANLTTDLNFSPQEIKQKVLSSTKFTGRVLEMQSLSCTNQQSDSIEGVKILYYIEFTSKQLINSTSSDKEGYFNLYAENPLINGQFNGIFMFQKDGYLSNEVDITYNTMNKDQEYPIGTIQLINMSGLKEC
ncbi:unnamed protein product [Paramecium primaurelia]|uniref:Uncharacterized protein n=1 Tax=Paramecium primaurelia TaxID=5886 RepID=A0A8S1NGA1_PARPR|nr:unnamed protein product [Paramecium primaurelia]